MGTDAKERKSLMQQQRSLGTRREEKAEGVSLIKQDLQLSKRAKAYNYQKQKKEQGNEPSH